MKLDLEAIRKRCEEARKQRPVYIEESTSRQVPHFIKTALLDIPALIARVEELEKENSKLKREKQQIDQLLDKAALGLDEEKP